MGARNVMSVVHLLESLVERYHCYPSHVFTASTSCENLDSYFVFTTNPGNFDNSTTLLDTFSTLHTSPPDQLPGS
jgi:hypothetical protein